MRENCEPTIVVTAKLIHGPKKDGSKAVGNLNLEKIRSWAETSGFELGSSLHSRAPQETEVTQIEKSKGS